MTTPERREPDLDPIRELIARATPEQVRRLIEDLTAVPRDERIH